MAVVVGVSGHWPLHQPGLLLEGQRRHIGWWISCEIRHYITFTFQLEELVCTFFHPILVSVILTFYFFNFFIFLLQIKLGYIYSFISY